MKQNNFYVYESPECTLIACDTGNTCLCASTDSSSVDKLVVDDSSLQWAD